MIEQEDVMQGINRVILIGNVGRTPELKYTPDGRPIASFSLATNRMYKDRAGERRRETEWHRVVSFGRLAEVCGQYLDKGRPIYVEGRLQTRKWADKDGNTRSKTEVLCDTVQLLGGRRGKNGAQPAPPILTDGEVVAE